MPDITHAKLSPSSEFNHPKEVMESSQISREDKIKILKQWEYDTKELLTATEENMGGDSDNTGQLLSEIQNYLLELAI